MSQVTEQRMAELERMAEQLGRRARQAARQVALADTEAKDRWLREVAASFRDEYGRLAAANQRDIDAAPGYGLTAAQVDRLRLDRQRVAAMAESLEQIADLADPVGEVIESFGRPNGLRIRKVRVPLGVILFIYESRPNVTADAAALCVKSGNAVILRGGKEAMHSNRSLHRMIQQGLERAGLPAEAVQLVTDTDHELVTELLHLDRYIDLTIPRGGPGLIRRVAQEARMPVLKHYQGICHVYVHSSADLVMARSIVVNAKCQRPGVCNAAECLLVDRAVAGEFLPAMAAELQQAGVELRGCPQTQQLVPGVRPATDQDYATEYLDLKMSVRVVDGLEQAVEHIERFGSGHTEAIVTGDERAGEEFCRRVDSSVVLVNASTRFNDGGQFGFGAEVGISTDKFHARGPCGLRELTTYKYVVRGDGQVRT